MTPSEYTLTRIILLGLDIKRREGKEDYRVEALRKLYLSLKAGHVPDLAQIRSNFLGLDLIHFNRIFEDEVRIRDLL